MRTYGFFFLIIVFLAGCDSNNGVDTTGTSAASTLAPTVVWTDPYPGAVGPNIMAPNNIVRIRFSTLMDTRSVIHGVTLSPVNQSVYIDTTTAYPVEGTTFAFPLTPTPVWLVYLADPVINSRFPANYPLYNSDFKVGQAYTITIDSSVHDIYGDYFGPAASFFFTPEPYFRVTDTYPLNNDTAVSPTYPYITIRFNSVIDTLTARSSFTISPSVVGSASIYYGSWGLSWSLPSTAMLASATMYTVTISTSIKDVNGNVPPSPYSISFTTASYAVTGSYPSGNGVSLNSSVDIYCNFLIDPTSMASAFSISPSVSGTLQNNGSSFTFTPQSSLAPNTTYTVTVSTALHGNNGTAVAHPYTFSFSTGS